MTRNQQTTLFLGLASVVAAATLAAYLPGLAAGLHFDDARNLDELREIKDIGSALAFILGGDSGPLGRPIALLSFALQHSHWPENVRAFHGVNIALHLLNGLLLGLLAYQLARLSPAFGQPERARWAALGVAAVWLALPLLASSSLFIIQRMTTLAATMVLSGLLIHLLGRQLSAESPRKGLALMTLAAGVGIGLGTLTKENAAVYVLVVLALDRTLLAGLPVDRGYRLWRIPFIILPAVLLVFYMLDRLVGGLDGGTGIRHFTSLERLATQSVILLDYLRLMLVPQSPAFGPFHDHYPIYGGWPAGLAIALTGGWFALAALAIAFGPRWPFPAFAVLWYLAAHFVESTWLPLELYYEHRNYLPAVGVVIALVFGLTRLPGRQSILAGSALGAYTVVLLFALVQVTALWGNPRLAAEIWWARDTGSLRAALYLANYYSHEGYPLIAARVIDTTAEHNPTQATLPLTSAHQLCIAGVEDRSRERFNSILRLAPNARYLNHQPDNDARALELLLNDIVAGRCKALGLHEVHALAQAFLENPIVQNRSSTAANYHVIRAIAFRHQDDHLEIMQQLLAAIERSPRLQNIETASRLAHESGLRDWLHRIHRTLPPPPPAWKPFERKAWEQTANIVEQRVRDLENGNP
ncbi:hypothetical protein [Thioalkalivibrio sp. ALMg9]|uniref:hypothetical protein n=1 Tax=Thioalkalivibrio sp. ALMg9 TaxID=1266912 RepID=UPI0003738AB4|nr:hypothetical protein [Thioalkalivibrio sp. ALMg9]